MDYVNRISRAGVLAAAVAVGAAVAATPAVSNAAPGASTSSASESGVDSGAAPAVNPTAGATKRANSGRPNRDRAAISPNVAPTRGSMSARTREDSAPSPAAVADQDAPELPTNAGSDSDNPPAGDIEATSTSAIRQVAAAVPAVRPLPAPAEPAPAVRPLPAPAEPATAVAAAVDAMSKLVTSALGPLGPIDGGTHPGLWAVLAFVRRDIGDESVIPGAAAAVETRSAPAPTAATPTSSAPVLSSLLDGIQTFIDNAVSFIQTYVDPPLIRLIVDTWELIFHNPPPATPVQVELNLGQGVTSNPIAFAGTGSTDRDVIYSVPGTGAPGGPVHGTVAIDNSTGTFTYTPNENFTGTDTFSFVVKDTSGIRLLDDLIYPVLDFLGMSDGFTNTATATIFNGVPIQPVADVPAYTDITGNFSMLTYNVSGMPSLDSGAPWTRALNMLDIGSRINAFDVVNVQEDVAYQPLLAANTSFADLTEPSSPTWLGLLGMPFSDGLNSFAQYGMHQVLRFGWSSCTVLCTGTGFVYSRLEIPGGESVDLYNIDTTTELTNDDIAQLSTFIQQTSLGRAVIVSGDFNQLYSDSGQTLSEFATANGLTDAWVQLEYGGIVPPDAETCAYESSCEQTDKIFYRSADPLNFDDPASSPVQLIAQTYANEGLNFRNGNDQDLSSHTPQAVTFSYVVDSIGPSNVDPANWMADLPGISTLPFTQLPIPGTHDSGSYGITASSEWALTGKSDFGILTQLPPLIEKFLVKPIVAGWARTQGMSIAEQFANGNRYVDLRFSYEPDGEIYIEHGLRGQPADEVIDQIAEFAYSHPKEALFINVWGLNNFDANSNAELVAKMESAFGSRMAPSSLGTSATLEDLWAIDKNVIVMYNNSDAVAMNPNLWDISENGAGGPTLWRPWPNVPSAPLLYQGNVDNLASRPSSGIWDLFGEPTENTTNIIMGILLLGPGNERAYMARWHPYLQPWMQVDFKPEVNLVTEDWFQDIGSTSSSYARDVMAAVYETLGSRLASGVSGSSVG
jgi:hypothetical protein